MSHSEFRIMVVNCLLYLYTSLQDFKFETLDMQLL